MELALPAMRKAGIILELCVAETRASKCLAEVELLSSSRTGERIA
jgi:hypothetical protein